MMTSLSPDFQVAVVGGGVIGKASALACAQAGFRVALVAPVSAVATSADSASIELHRRVYALSRSSQTLFERLRVWQAVDQSRLSPVYDMRITGDGGAQLHFSAFQANVAQLGWIAEAALLERALDSALSFQTTLAWYKNTVKQLTIAPSAARLTLDDATALETELVIGADGVHSWVRTQMGFELQRRDYQQTAVVAHFSTEKPHADTAYQWFDKGDVIALLPLSNSQVSLVWSTATAQGCKLVELDAIALAQRVTQATGGVLGELTPIQGTAAQGFALARQTVQRLISPRIALVGDAAHLIHPLAGQGMNLGLRDVASLVQLLVSKEPFRDCGDSVLLRRYERSRRGDIRNLIALTDGLQRIFALPSACAQLMRHKGLTFLDKQPFIKRWLVSMAMG